MRNSCNHSLLVCMLTSTFMIFDFMNMNKIHHSKINRSIPSFHKLHYDYWRLGNEDLIQIIELGLGEIFTFKISQS